MSGEKRFGLSPQSQGDHASPLLANELKSDEPERGMNSKAFK